jgi:transposase-like protein
MKNANDYPRTLIEAIRYFSDVDVATEFVARLRWPDGPVCPKCGSKNYSYLETRRLWKCKVCQRQFSVKVGTIFENSPIRLDKWLVAIWMLANSKDVISSYEIHHTIGVTQKTAWSMMHRISLAMQTETFERLSGQVEIERGSIGDEARNLPAGRPEEKVKGRGSAGEIAI